MKSCIIDNKKYLTIDREDLDFVKIAITTSEIDSKDRADVEKTFKDIFTLKNLSKNQQIHSDIVNKKDKSNFSEIIDGDAIITDEKNIPLMILTADCVPVVLVDTKNKAVGLAHAGWRGTYAKICEKTLDLMKKEYNTSSKDVVAIIGPSIGSCCYEVSSDLVEKFKGVFTENNDFYFVKDDKNYLDLWKVNEITLKSAGVLEENIINMEICTSCNSDRFHSYRKHVQTPKRIGTFIEINE